MPVARPRLYAHPFSSYSQKALIALYENQTPFDYRNLEDAQANAELAALWPMRRFPVLVDGDRTVIEATSVIEYLDLHYPGPVKLIPDDRDTALEVRMLDRFFDNYISTPQQKVVLDRLRPEADRDPHGVKEARAMLETAYAWLDERMATREWAVGPAFTLADCAAAPFLFTPTGRTRSMPVSPTSARIASGCSRVLRSSARLTKRDPTARIFRWARRIGIEAAPETGATQTCRGRAGPVASTVAERVRRPRSNWRRWRRNHPASSTPNPPPAAAGPATASHAPCADPLSRISSRLSRFVLGVVFPAASVSAGPPQVYGTWHCSNDFCTWGTARTVTEFDSKNRWLVDRGDGRPSVNLVVLSFVHPLKLLNQTTDATTLNGVPRGITPEIVGYFTSRGVRVMLSIGGITYTNAWNQALGQNAELLGLRAAQVATQLGVGIEIDYEENTSPNLAGLQTFIDAYRGVHPVRRHRQQPRAPGSPSTSPPAIAG